MPKTIHYTRRLWVSSLLTFSGIITLLLRKYLYTGILSLILILLSLSFFFLTLLRLKASEKLFTIFSWIFHIGFGLVFVSFLIAEGLVIGTARRSNHADNTLPENIDTIMVAGAGLRKEKPSLLYQLRLDRARALLDANPHSRVVICGGQGNDELLSEARAGQNYLLSVGVSPDRITIEEESLDTAENIRNFASLFPDKKEIALVTNDFHAYRCVLLAKRYGIHAIPYSSPTPRINLILNYFAREYISLLIALIESRGLTINTANTHLFFPVYTYNV